MSIQYFWLMTQYRLAYRHYIQCNPEYPETTLYLEAEDSSETLTLMQKSTQYLTPKSQNTFSCASSVLREALCQSYSQNNVEVSGRDSLVDLDIDVRM